MTHAQLEDGPPWSGRASARKPPVLPAPPVSVRDGELYVHVHEPGRDEFGRVRFFLYWHDAGLPALGPKGGPDPGTVRGQVFCADERPRIAAALAEGTRVFMWPSGEEVTAP